MFHASQRSGGLCDTRDWMWLLELWRRFSSVTSELFPFLFSSKRKRMAFHRTRVVTRSHLLTGPRGPFELNHSFLKLSGAQAPGFLHVQMTRGRTSENKCHVVKRLKTNATCRVGWQCLADKSLQLHGIHSVGFLKETTRT